MKTGSVLAVIGQPMTHGISVFDSVVGWVAGNSHGKRYPSGSF